MPLKGWYYSTVWIMISIIVKLNLNGAKDKFYHWIDPYSTVKTFNLPLKGCVTFGEFLKLSLACLPCVNWSYSQSLNNIGLNCVAPLTCSSSINIQPALCICGFPSVNSTNHRLKFPSVVIWIPRCKTGGYRGLTMGLEHQQISVSARAPGTNLPWIPRLLNKIQLLQLW